MFDFSTETILNDLNKVSVLTNADDPTIPTGEKALYVKSVGKFPQPTSTTSIKVKSAFKAVGYLDVNEIAEIDLTGIDLASLTGKVIRLAVDVRLSGAESGEYARWAVHKGQPFYAEYFVKTQPATVTALVTSLAAAFDKAYRKDGVALIRVTANANKLVLTATNSYQVFEGSQLELIVNAFDDTAVILAEGVVTTKGKEGFGTTWFLTKNLRMPTIEATRFMGEFQDQRPLVNTLYNQYTLQLSALRNIGASAYVGGKGTSITTHVFYVPQTLATAFEADLTSVLGAGFLKLVP